MQVSIIGIDLAKNVFQVCGVNQAGKQLFNKTLSRAKLFNFILGYPDAIIAMEACSGSNSWGRKLLEAGFEVRIIPPIHVKPFVRGNKNDRNDAFAITEAAVRPHMHFVNPRTLEQSTMMMWHKARRGRVEQRTALTNQIRGFLNECHIVVGQGAASLRKALGDILEDAQNGLPFSLRVLINDLWQQWQLLDNFIDKASKEIERHAQESSDCKRLMEIDGVGHIISTAIVAYAGDGKDYKNGRQFAANLGVTPKEHSSGGKHNLGAITKRGNRYLRSLLVQGAWSVIKNAQKRTDRLSRWALAVIERRGKHKAALAVANKLARISWSVLYHKTEYQPG